MSPPSTSSTTTQPAKKERRILACVLCQQRKKKCDRQSPCSNCIKLNMRCIPSTPAPARKRRRPTKELLERLARCEEQLRLYTEHGCVHALSPDSTCSKDHTSRPGAASPGTESSTSVLPSVETTADGRAEKLFTVPESMRTPPEDHSHDHDEYRHQHVRGNDESIAQPRLTGQPYLQKLLH